MLTQQRVELRYAADKSSLSYNHKLGTISRIFADGSFQVSFDAYVMDDGKRRIWCRGGRYTYPARMIHSFNLI